MKGNVQDIAVIGLLLLVTAITALFAQTMLTEIDNNTNQSQLDQHTLQEAQNALNIFDYGIIAGNIMLWIVSLIFAYQIKSSPIFFFPAIIGLALNTWISMQIANIYGAMARNSALTSAANNFSNLTTYMSNYGVIAAALGMVMLVFLYGKVSGPEATV